MQRALKLTLKPNAFPSLIRLFLRSAHAEISLAAGFIRKNKSTSLKVDLYYETKDANPPAMIPL